MTHQNHQTNGASLEDCHTNFYALTDLCGIKWRKFVNGERPNASSDPLDDPILRSYSRCMQADILCVWRRVQSTKQDNSDPNALAFDIITSKVHPPLSLAAAKELWIFWYGEEPELSKLVDAELLRVAANQTFWKGTWKGELTYEFRSLLFKALHNLMERFVLTKDIVRFGKWFVQPCTSSERLFGRSSQHLSFSFTFFVHGDTVCASIDLREHPAVRPLTKEHLAEAAAAFTVAASNSTQSHEQNTSSPKSPADSSNIGCNVVAGGSVIGGSNNGDSGDMHATASPVTPKPRKVILAPFGMAATLTGNSYKASDPMADKILEDWASFFPLCNKDNTDVPPVVEVVSGGHKMYHPTNYVLVTDLDDMEEMEISALQKGTTISSSSAEAAALASLSSAAANVVNHEQMASNGTLRKNIIGNPADSKLQILTNTTSTLFNKTGGSTAERLAAVTDSTTTSTATTATTKFQPFYDIRSTSGFTCHTTNTHAPPTAAVEMPERAWQDCITNPLHVDYSRRSMSNNSSSNAIDGTKCTTNTTTSSSGGGGGSSSEADDNVNGGSNDNNQTSTIDSKQQVQLQIQQQQQQQRQKLWEYVDPTQKAPCICTKPSSHSLVGGNNTPHGTPQGGGSTYSRNSIGDSMPVPSVGSPATPAPSPHPNSALSQPTSVPPSDQLVNMSPRAPTSVSNLQQPSTPIDHLLDKNTPAPTPTDQHDNKSITASPYVHQMPSVEPPNYTDGGPGSVPQPTSVGRCTPTIGQQQQQQQQNPQCGTISVKKFELQQALTPLSGGMEIKQEVGVMNVTTTTLTMGRMGLSTNVITPPQISTADAINNFLKLYKPPQLTPKDVDTFYDDDWLKDIVYDFSNQDAWNNYPVKRIKPNEVSKPRRARHTKNLYEGHTHFKPLMPSPGSVYGAHLLSIDAASATINSTRMDTSNNINSGSMSGGLVGIASGIGGCSMNSNGGGSGSGSDDTDGNLTSGAGGYFQGLDIKTEPGTTSPCKESKSTSIGGNLYTAEGLNPSLNDLEQLFETSSNDECSSVQIHTPPDSNNPSNGGCTVTNTIDELKRSTAAASVFTAAAAAVVGNVALAALQNCSNSNSGANTIQAEDLTKMFPTPPSHEQQHPNSSPCQMDIQMTDLSIITTSLDVSATVTASVGVASAGIIKIKQEYSVELGSPIEEPIDDWSFVYRPPQQEKFVGSSKYAPLTNLPSQTLPSLNMPINCIYKPTWTKQKSRAAAAAAKAAQAAAVQQQQQQQQQQQAQQQQHQQQQQSKQQHLQFQHQQQQKHQQLHELLSAAPRTPLQQPRTPLGPMPSPMHSGGASNTVPQPLSSGGSNLLLNQLNCPQAALTNTSGGNMQHLMQRAGMSPISPAPAGVVGVPFPRGSPAMLQAQQRQTPIHPPPPYEMAVVSPATSTSSYLNKQFNSQEHPHTPQSVGGMHTGVGGMHNSGGHGMSLYAGGVGTSCATGIAGGVVSATHELPEVSSVMVNILLYDTALNVFRDHNFDSSTVCVCNADTHKIGNIRGADSGVYVPLPGSSFNPSPTGHNGTAATHSLVAGLINGGVSSSGGGGGTMSGGMRMLSAFGGGGSRSALASPASLPGAGSGHNTGSNSSSSCTPPSSNQHITGYVDDDPVDCTCGFSAVVNRRLSYRAGLFYEDELEITGIAEDPGRNKQPTLLSLITSLCTKAQSNELVPEKSCLQAEQLSHAIFDLLLDQCSIIQTSSSSIHRALQRHRRRMTMPQRKYIHNTANSESSIAKIANVLEFIDAHDIVCLALEQARLAFESQRMDIGEFPTHQQQLSPFNPTVAGAIAANRKQLLANRLTVHKWPYIPVGFSRSNNEIVRTMNSIQPMLQNAFHTKSRSAAASKDATYTVSGPLTWRQFHRLAGRASGQCEPQPIPSVIVGYDKDWISVAPHSIHYWDKFLLEPYSYARDVAYLIICPDDDYVISNTRTYFRELSSTYEMCKLGRHTPIRGWDGLLTVGARPASENVTTPLDDWLRTLADTKLAEQIRVYAVAFMHMLSPYLCRIPADKTLLNPPEHNNNNSGNSSNTGVGARGERGTTSPNGNGNVMQSDSGDKLHNNSPKLESSVSNSGAVESTASTANNNSNSETVDTKADIKSETKPTIVLGDPLGVGDATEDINPAAIVLYVVEPFTFGSDSPELERLACIAVLRCYAELLKTLPDSVRAYMNIQIISLESIMELGPSGNRKRFSDEIKCLALNIFSQCRRHMVHAQAVKSLTGFGTAANMEAFLKTKDEQNRRAYKMYTPPFVLAPMHERNDRSDFSRASSSMRGPNEQKYSVMYCNYCLSEDQSWLLATATDDRGEMLEKVCINIDVPNRARRRKTPARYIALKKLMDFIMGLISQTAQTWRLVIGRIGRIGHSELKSWSFLLSKQHLQKASKQFKDICKQCTLMFPPTILSACLVTLEPDAKLRVMPDQFTPDERFSQISMQNPLSTPQDVTCTHILVFPTSAVCLSFTRQFPNEPQVDLDNDFFFEEEENEGITDVDLGDLLWDTHIDRVSNHGSPGRMEDNHSWQSAGGNNFKCAQQQDVEEVGSINQQPLAVGYMVSTAPTGRMPAWFWSACPHLEDVCPVFLKTALHLHVPNIQTIDDILNSTNAHQSANDHPLDSTLTADVLRYVLEGYNALSWLALDSNTHDRLSCLPINVQTLMDLYYLTAAIA